MTPDRSRTSTGDDGTIGARAAVSTLQAVVGELQRAGRSSRADLTERLALPPATIARSVARLLRDGVLQESGSRPSTGGRPTRLIGVNPRVAVAVAVDVGASALTTAIVDLDGGITAVDDSRNDPAGSLEVRFPHVLDAIALAMNVARREGMPCVAVGVSVPSMMGAPGPPATQTVSEAAAASLAEAIRARFDLPVTIERDANLLAFAEARWGEGRESAVLVAIALSWGLGAGIVIDGNLYRGSGGGAGRIGSMLIGGSPPHTGSPWRADLEGRIGVGALAHRLRDDVAQPADELAVVDRLVAAATGAVDAPATEALDALLDDLAVAVANLVVVLDPEVVVFSGVLGEHIDAFAPALVVRLERTIPRVPRLVASALGPTAWLSAAGLLAIESAGPLLTLLRPVEAQRSTPARTRGNTSSAE